VTIVTALFVPTAAVASLSHSDSGLATSARNAIATGNQTEGRLSPNNCATSQQITVTRPSSIQVLIAGTNAGGHLYAQVTSPSGAAGPESGSYDATTPGRYGVRVCFISDDGIDSDISYVYTTVVTPR
jgi:hypothetical protein